MTPKDQKSADTQLATKKLNKEDLERPIGSEKTIADLFLQYKRAFESAAPKHLDINRVMRIALMDVSRNRDLMQCTLGSLLGCMMIATQLGLELGGPLGLAYLVPFKNSKNGNRKECQLIVGYKGLIKLARNSGEISSFTANVVYKGDKFQFEDGLIQVLKHLPQEDGDEKDEDIIAAYAIARFKDGGHQAVCIRRKRLDKIRKLSKAPNSDAWKDHLPEMFKKACIRRLAKLLPQSPELAVATKIDERAFDGVPQNIELLPGDDGAFGSAAVLGDGAAEDSGDAAAQQVVSDTEHRRLLAWGNKHKWLPDREGDFRAMLIKAVPYLADSINEPESTISGVLARVGSDDFERVIALLEEGPDAFSEANKPGADAKQGSQKEAKAPAADAKITEAQYDDLWASVTETKERREASQKFISELGYKNFKEIKQKDFKKVCEFAANH